MIGRHVIYALRDPRDGAVRYIGKTGFPATRLRFHLAPCNLRTHTKKTCWLKKIVGMGLRPTLDILEECAADTLSDAECFWIAQGHGLGWRLTNGTSGGDGLVNPSAEIREKIASKLRGRTLPPEHVEASAAGNRGKTRTAEHKARISAWMLGNTNGAGHRKTDERRAADSLAKGGRPFQRDDGLIFHSLRQAAEQLGLDHSALRRVLKGRARSAGGHHFTYLDQGEHHG